MLTKNSTRCFECDLFNNEIQLRVAILILEITAVLYLLPQLLHSVNVGSLDVLERNIALPWLHIFGLNKELLKCLNSL